MLHKRLRLPTGGKARPIATPRQLPHGHHAGLLPFHMPAAETTLRTSTGRGDVHVSAASYDAKATQDVTSANGHRAASLRLTAEAEVEASTAMVTTRFVVPHFVTKPGQQLFLTGSTPELGEFDPHMAVPLEWHEGHQHSAIVRLPSSRVVQVKLLLKEDGQPSLTEEGNPRDVMLMPVNEGAADGSSADGLPNLKGVVATVKPEAASAARPSTAGPRLDYQIMCHFGNTEAFQILRLPVVLPAKQPGDRQVLCKFVVLMDGLKLEARQNPVVVGSVEELGNWNTAGGVKLMRQVGGYWTRRVELPLVGNEIQAKVVICNADGQAVLWEPGTANRVLAASHGVAAGAMHIFVCRWSQPDFTAVVSVPVEYENANKEYIKMLDAAQREIGVMRRAVTAKSRQCQGLESELAASRRAERALREEVAMLRSEMGYLVQEVEDAQKSELSARQEVAEVQAQLQEVAENYERQIAFLESKLDEMEAELFALQDRLDEQNGSGSNGNGHSSHAAETEPAISRSSWR